MSMSRPPLPRQQADAIRHAGQRACRAGLPETVNPYNQCLAAKAWTLWRKGWHLGAEERVDAAMEVIALCDDCAAAVESERDPLDRPGLLGIIKGCWPAHDRSWAMTRTAMSTICRMTWTMTSTCSCRRSPAPAVAIHNPGHAGTRLPSAVL
ncbi:hypothetical protein HN018_27525 (plasmid) [Lichenicola cladoniae]|uniref:Uncharacterized protein n=1 Tax=Lichenicola cladoniae TaxID=1484109 RepID=A0A6M8I1L7_9PROT|nr:hypothetical protein [Lichenicola cladoniae]NPD68196.1 hypothetical protein [Acetobacteraceae bacterium]QKE93623.1 hypothetical protein HN018_26035 [Lichenicola cladoniae]QKE93881.1 hypothetical protein HN018_27525 [Lichenicola cladoniae]